MEKIIQGIKLITHNACGINKQDDITFGTWRLDAFFRAPDFMTVAFIGLFGGTEQICVRGKTKKALEGFAKMNNLWNHPRKISLKIWQPER